MSTRPHRMRLPILLSQLAAMSVEERTCALDNMKPNGVGVQAQIRELEERHGMTSDTMRAKVREDKLDTADTSRWLVLLSALGR